jgi:DNA-binding GntR family transcriptional regulator
MMAMDTPSFIYDTLQKEILNLTIKPGGNLVEAEICERFAASRTPVRTAFQRLSDAGLLDIIPYKGAFAPLLDFDYIKQMIYLRIAVESKVIKDCITLDDPFLMERIRYSLRCQRVLLDGGFTPEAFYTMDGGLHRLWFEATGKDLLWQTIQNFQVQYTRFRMLDIVAVHNFSEIVNEHEELFTILMEKNSNAVESFIEKHLMGGITRLGNRISTEFADYFEHDGV